MAVDQGYINHIALVLDASSSMEELQDATIQVADNQVQYLAERTRGTDQETRMTVYTFSYNTECVYYDKDVLRLESIRGKYNPYGMTALCDATLKAIEDLKQTATLYGDHAFLVYVLTDGEENHSSMGADKRLQKVLSELPDNWTVAVLVPNERGRTLAKKYGFFDDNIARWETTAKGIKEVGEVLQKQTDSYMTMRSQGIRSTRGIFTLDVNNLTKTAVKKEFKKLSKDDYETFVVQTADVIKNFVEFKTGRPYQKGSAFYQFTKSELIQGSKDILIRHKRSGEVFQGANIRDILGLPFHIERVKPADHPDYDFYIQSTSYTRKLVEGTHVLVLK